MINLLSYTKTLSDRIRFYDKISEKAVNIFNPFAKPINITIVWVDEGSCADES